MRLVSHLTSGAFLHSGGAALTRRLHTERAVVLRYHSVRPDEGPEPSYVSPSISLPVSLFERQIDYLVRNYHPVSLGEVVHRLRTGQGLSPLSVVITFDDGYLDNYLFALPVLKKYRVPATIFLVSSTLTDRRLLWTSRLRYAISKTDRATLGIENPSDPGTKVTVPIATPGDRIRVARTLTNLLNRLPTASRERSLADIFDQAGVTQFPPVEEWFLTPGQIKDALSAGIEFGAHTVNHPNLPGVPGPEAAREIAQSKLDLECTIGVPIHHFSYPNSGSLYAHFDETVARRVETSGFDSAVTSVDGWIDTNSNRFLVNRVGVNRSRGPLHRFAWHLERIRLASASNTKAA